MTNAPHLHEPMPEPLAPLGGRLGPDRPSDWGSLVEDLSRRDEPTFHIHDRTHVEFSIDYRLTPGKPTSCHVWEVFFFAPESLRLDSRTYDKSDLYTDLQSYVRYEVPQVEFGALAGQPVECVRAALVSGNDDSAMREMRLFACQVRSAGVALRGRILDALSSPEDQPRRALHLAARMATEAQRITTTLRDALSQAEGRSDSVRTAARWIDEDVSRLMETLLTVIARRLVKHGAPPSLIETIERAALSEARYRLDAGIHGVGTLNMKRREIEALEFRRHVLKRFTASVLWLSPEVRPGSTWVLQLLYAIAASLAMAFAIAAAFWNGFEVSQQGWLTWVLIAVVAYAIKDRLKAVLQTAFSGVVERHFPDRRWLIRDQERGVNLGTMKEQSGFIPFRELPEAVLAARRVTRRHPLEEQARPETVIYHKKEVLLRSDRVADSDPRFSALTEIFRLDFARWLAHTDDPKRDIVFADPVSGKLGSAEAPRVYNIAAVYRLRLADEADAPWHRLRIVVSRKGIRRIENIR